MTGYYDVRSVEDPSGVGQPGKNAPHGGANRRDAAEPREAGPHRMPNFEVVEFVLLATVHDAGRGNL